MTALSAREQTLAHALIDDQLDALGVAAWITGWVMGPLDELARQLRALLADPAQRRHRLDVLLEAMDRADARVQALLLTALLDWAPLAQAATVRSLQQVLPALRSVRVPAPPRRADDLLGLIIAGRPLQHWLRGQTQHLRRTLVREVRGGHAQGLTALQIADRILGDALVNPSAAGVLPTARRQLRQLVHASVQTLASQQREAVYRANPDLVRGLRWLATLDGRSCPFCGARDGRVYGMDHRPRGHDLPWGGGPGACHFGCRCISLPVLASWRELGVNIDDFQPLQRPSQDGPVPATLRFEDWLAAKPEDFPDRYFGPGRAQLWREHKLTLAELLDARGRPLPLDTLRARLQTTTATTIS